MSWFDPPPLIQKPLHPSVHIAGHPAYRQMYTIGIVLWIISLQALWFLILLARFFAFKPRPIFWFRPFWLIEAALIFFAAWIGHVVMTIILTKKLLNEKPE